MEECQVKNPVNPVLKRAVRDEKVHKHGAGLPDAVGPVGSLVLDGRVPPAVVVYDMRGLREVQAETARLQRQDKRRGRLGCIEGGDLRIAHGRGLSPVQEEHLSGELLFDERLEPFGDLHVLGEHQRGLSGVENALQKLKKTLHLAAIHIPVAAKSVAYELDTECTSHHV